MAFATDRDLLELEPGVFRDAAWTAQRVINGTGSIAGTTLTLGAGGVTFADARIDAGSVVLIDSAPVEVVERTGALVVTVSRLRASVDDDPIPLADDATVKIEAYTFGAAIGGVHRRVLRMLGIEPDDTAEDALTEASIVNPTALTRLEALGALAAVYAAASAAGPVGTEMGERAEAYRRRFADERQRAAARIDLDGDGVADSTRRLNVIQFVRG